jgi:hypothetical protein
MSWMHFHSKSIFALDSTVVCGDRFNERAQPTFHAALGVANHKSIAVFRTKMMHQREISKKRSSFEVNHDQRWFEILPMNVVRMNDKRSLALL